MPPDPGRTAPCKSPVMSCRDRDLVWCVENVGEYGEEWSYRIVGHRSTGVQGPSGPQIETLVEYSFHDEETMMLFVLTRG